MATIDYIFTDKDKSDVRDVTIKIFELYHNHSAIVCLSKYEAKNEFDILQELKECEYVAKAHCVLPHKTDDVLALAIIEKVATLETWLHTGTHFDFRRFCFQVCQGLHFIHNTCKTFHGNIMNGVMIGENNNVRICKFLNQDKPHLSDEEIAKRQRKDFVTFFALAQKVYKKWFPIIDQSGPINHASFLKMCSFFKKQPEPNSLIEYRNLSKWIYHAPYFWNSRKILDLYKHINNLLDGNCALLNSKNFLFTCFDWSSKLPMNKERSLYKCRYHNPTSYMYNYPLGVLRFSMNYTKHHKNGRTEIETMQYVTSFFPRFLENFYREVMRLKDVVFLYGCQTKTLDAILWGSESFFNMDGVPE